MARPRRAVVTKKRTVHTYSELWHASRCVLDLGLTNPSGSSWQFLSSIILTALAFEAYLNHVGPTTIGCWSGLERLSPWSKFELLCETLGVKFSGGPDKRPLQTLSKLLDFRNTIAHGRSVTIQPKPELRDVNAKLDSYLGERPLVAWERLVQTEQFAKRARDDVKAVLKSIHAARKEPKEGLFTFGIGMHRATLAAEP